MSARSSLPRRSLARHLLPVMVLAVLLLAMLAVPALHSTPGGDTASAQGTFTRGVNWTGQFYTYDPAVGFSSAFVNPVGGNVSYPVGLDYVWDGVPTDGNGFPIPGAPADNFSAVFVSSQIFPQTGVYTFTVTIDDIAIITIDEVQVLFEQFPGTYTFTFNLAAGEHIISIGLIELTQTAIIQFGWALGDTGPVGTPGPTGPTGNVVQVRGLSLRTGPYLGASFIGVLRPDTAYPVLARSDDEGGIYTWYKVQVGDQIGWSSGRYLTINGDIDSIPFESTVFEQIDNPPDRGVIAAPRAVMNLRRRPSVRSPRLGQVPWGEEVPLLGRTIQGGLNFWFQVRYEGIVGWIFAPFVSVRGNIDAVPVY